MIGKQVIAPLWRQTNGEYRIITVTVIQMESVHQPKVNLSFSIENILRDDFPHRQRANGCNFISQHESSFERWSNTAVYPPYHAVHYSPVIVKSLPNRPQGQILFEEHNKMDDCSNCKHEALRHENGKNYILMYFLNFFLSCHIT